MNGSSQGRQQWVGQDPMPSIHDHCESVGRKMPTHTFFSPIGVPFLLMSNPPSPALSVIALTESIRLSVTCR